MVLICNDSEKGLVVIMAEPGNLTYAFCHFAIWIINGLLVGSFLVSKPFVRLKVYRENGWFKGERTKKGYVDEEEGRFIEMYKSQIANIKSPKLKIKKEEWFQK